MILGIDEVGRGPYAGPLVVGACILPNLTKEAEKPGFSDWILELTDSKKCAEIGRASCRERV